MKYIRKNPPPLDFLKWLEDNIGLTPTYDDAPKASLRDALLREQGFICCYCERRVDENDSHIEHLKPQNMNSIPELALDYGNMLCSCQKNLKKGEPLHCGNSKQAWYSDALLVSPLDITCERRFRYTSDGRILPSNSDDAAAVETIRRLKLDIDKLNRLRKAAIDAHGETDKNIIIHELNNPANCLFIPFHTAIAIYYGCQEV